MVPEYVRRRFQKGGELPSVWLEGKEEVCGGEAGEGGHVVDLRGWPRSPPPVPVLVPLGGKGAVRYPVAAAWGEEEGEQEVRKEVGRYVLSDACPEELFVELLQMLLPGWEEGEWLP